MPPPSPPAGAPAGIVVLLHGLGRTGLSMYPIARALRRAGYPTLSPWYGHGRSMAGIVAHLAPRIDRFAAAHPGPLHIVTHSLGGLVARAFITANRPAMLGRVVTLSPPNAGSALADFATRIGLGSLILGRVGAHLHTRRTAAVAAELGPVDFDLGIIAGAPDLSGPAPYVGANSVNVVAMRGGYARVLVALGDTVSAGQHVATISDPFGRTVQTFTTPIAGRVTSIATAPTREIGDLLVRVLAPVAAPQ
jgi:hypothetical protein